MAERGMSPEDREDIERIERESIDIGTGMGGGFAPVLPTDLDSDNPDTAGLASSKESTQIPNWIAAEEVEPGLERLEPEREPLHLPKDTHIVTVFGEDLGRIEEVYGYAPSNDPQWAAIKEGGRKVLVPLMSAQLEDDRLQVPYPKNLIESAPELPEHEISLAEEMAFYSHYNERRMLPAADGYTQEQERTLHVISSAA